MDKISKEEFLIRQPGFPQTSDTDEVYLRIARRLLAETSGASFCKKLPESLTKRIVLTLTDYLQDIVADGGLWRSFVDANRELYGWSVPFHQTDETYIDYELNLEDVRFLVWYMAAMLWEDTRLIYPHDTELLEYADLCFSILDAEYDDAPVNPDYAHLSRGLEFNDPDDREKIYHLGNWLFLHSYLLTPAFALSLKELIEEIGPGDQEDALKLNTKLEEAMLQNTTGPLALFTPEWVYLMIEGKLPKEKEEESTAPHRYYTAFTDFTGGKDIAWFDTYEAMNDFFIDALGWEKGVEHLSQAKGAHDYILMVNKNKGMLLARDIARCIASPDNPLYDREYAENHSIQLLTDRGVCPGDLLKRILSDGLLPDARFPGTDDFELVKENNDFIARCYLQIYYRGD